MKKFLSTLSSTLQGGVRGGLLFLLFFASAINIYASDIKVGGIWYDFDSSTKTASVTYRGYDYDSYDGEYSGIVIIPETVTYNGTTYSVTRIGSYAFNGCSSLTSVTIPNSVTSIGSYAFDDCSSLTSVTIPNSVTSIGYGAFDDCSSLTSVTIGESVTSIGSYAFYDCSSLTSVTIGESVTSIGDNAFGYCSSLTSVTIPNSVTSIGEEAFKWCSSLTSVTIGESVKSIGVHAFYGCEALTSIVVKAGNTTYDSRENCNAIIETTSNTLIAGCQKTIIPNSVTSIGSSAFKDCSSLTSVTIPNSVTSIGEEAFKWCSSLTSVTINSDAIVNKAYSSDSNISHIFGSQVTEYIIGESVTSIGVYAFYRCSSLTSVTIPNSVTSIGEEAFYGCSSLTKTNYTGDIAGWCNIEFGDIYANPMYCSHNFYINDQEIKDLVIPNNVTSIGYAAFQGCSSLTSVTIGESVTSIGYAAFQGCSSLTSVTIGESVTSIGYAAFQGCSSLTSVTIPNSVTSIGSSAFRYCYSLTSVIIGESVTSIGEEAFAGCSKLTSVTIGESVTSIGSSAFEACSSLTSVTIPNSVTSIGEEAFYGCSSLTKTNYTGDIAGWCNIEFGDIYANPMYCSHNFYINDQEIKDLVIPNNVTSIGSYAFNGCSSLTSVTIGESVTSIGSSAFRNCSSLTSVTINSDAIVSEAYSDGSNISHIFGSQVTEYIIGESVTSIGEEAFYGCSSLTSVTIGESVTSIGHYAFSSCSGLTSVTIPNSVTSIGGYAFEDCSSLTAIICEAATPPNLGSSSTSSRWYNSSYTFQGVSKSIPVYVPCGCEEAYKAAYGWNDFTNIQEPLAYSIEVNVNDTIMGTAKVDYNTFCEGNQISATPNFGYHFVQWSDGNTDTIRTLVLTQDTILTAEFAQSFSGQCGDNLYWSYDEDTKTISITGSGKMYDYTADTQPWLLFKEQIKEVTTTNTVTSIGTSAFEGCARLSKVSLGTGLEEIAANAFAGCTRLYDIYVYATYPPFAEESSFANYNVYVYIPCEYQRDYILDVVWGEFKFIECIDSEEATTDGNVTVDPGYNDVTITWPTEGNADTYTIVIKKDGEVVCTLTFNAEGQLLNIAFAPSRDGYRPAQYAEQAGNGYRFTVTGLEEATHYAYNIDVKNAANNTIKSHSGEFTTMGDTTTAVEDVLQNSTNCKKILRDNQLLILRDGVEYTIMGAEIK